MNLLFSILLALSLFFGFSLNAQAGDTLESAGARHGLSMGVAVKSYLLENKPSQKLYIKRAKRHFSSLTAASEMKMVAIQPGKNDFDFSAANKIVRFAQKNGQEVHGHALVWEASTPRWFEQLKNNKEKKQFMRDHIKKTVRHFKKNYPGVVTSWDVVNEVIGSGGGLRTNVFSSIGDEKIDYVYYAFNVAHRADPSADLYYNDFGIETVNTKSRGAVEFLKELIDRGAPIDGVGIQGHMSTDNNVPSVEKLRRGIRHFADLGLKVRFTELDVRIQTKDGTSKNEIQKMKDFYFNVTKACRLERSCVGVTIWGLYDGNSWIASLEGYSPVLPFTESFKRSQAYDQMLKALQ